MAITETIQAKEFEAGAPNIVLKGDLRPNQDMQMAMSDDANERALEQIFEQLLEEGFSFEEAAKKAREIFNEKAMAYGGRVNYGLGSFVKSIGKGVKGAVKGVAKGIKSVAKSDLGKAALAAAALYYGGPKVKGFFEGMSLPSLPTFGLSEKGAKTLGAFAIGSLGSAAISAAEAGGLDTSDPNAEVDLDSLTGYLTRGYKNLNPNATDEEVFQFVQENTAEYRAMGGRIGYSNGTPSFEEYLREREMLDKKGNMERLMKEYKEDMRRKKVMQQKQEAAEGGRIGYAMGDTASENAMQAAGIEGLPIRQNKVGVTELDLRETGGFIPPVGVKEKADDIPAMLSNNEFVFTADAVRAAGGGNINKGAQIMYDTMKQLESKVV